MTELQLYPIWKEFAKHIVKNKANCVFYSDEEIAFCLEADPESHKFRFEWLACRDFLQKTHGMEFIRIRYPKKGYKLMTDSEKVTKGYKRRFKKTCRNIKRIGNTMQHINPLNLTDNEKVAFESQICRSSLMAAVFLRLRKGDDNLRLTIEVEHKLPKMTS